MASTYSNLKIQLMATGENSTTWGDVTNTNLGTAIEEAIAGSADVTFASANVTLTLTDTNISQTARNMRLRLTGSTGGFTRNLVVPSIEKPYIVKNDCADNVVVKTAAGTGITVPPGKSMWLYVDGTNVVEAVSYLSTLSFGGTVSIAQGGTGANTAADARTNLGLGTLATQAANSVSITGGSISGITDLAVADGGTGASTAADARINLGLGTLATQDASNVTITGGSITGASVATASATITGGSISGITDLAIADGGTGASNAAGARTNLGLGTLATQNSNSVSITGGAISGASVATASATITGGSISGITDLAIADGGTGASNAAGARTNLLPAYAGNAGKILALNSIGTDVEWVSAGGSGTVNSVNASTSISGLSFTGGPITSSGTLILSGTLGVAGGGTGATDAANARTNLGLGTISTQNANSVAITGGAISGVTLSTTGTPTAPTAAYGTNNTQIATTAFVQAALQAMYPVGSVYINAAVTTNPATLLGFGTWVEIGAGRVLVGQNTGDASFDTLGETGGSKDAVVVSHTHSATATVSDPGHSHNIPHNIDSGTSGSYISGNDGPNNITTSLSIAETNTTGITVGVTVNSTGSSGTNANLQPYIVVKMWQRTA